MEREALKLAFIALEGWGNHDTWVWPETALEQAKRNTEEAIAAITAALAQPAHSEWNAALDEAAARIGEMKGFGQATQDSFAVFIKGLKR